MWKLIGSPYNIVFHLTAPGCPLRLGQSYDVRLQLMEAYCPRQMQFQPDCWPKLINVFARLVFYCSPIKEAGPSQSETRQLKYVATTRATDRLI